MTRRLRAGSIAVALLVTGAVSAQTARDPKDPLTVALPADWSMHVKIEPHSRHWHFAPQPLEDAMFESDTINLKTLLGVQLDVPRKDLAKLAGRELADAVFELKRGAYDAAARAVTLGEVKAVKQVGVDGFAVSFNSDDNVEEMFVASIDGLLLVVTFSYEPSNVGAQLDAGRKVVKSLQLDRLDPAAKTERYSDPHGICGVVLPAGWYFAANNDGESGTFVVSPDVIETPGECAVGCEIMVMPKYSRSTIGSPLGGSDEKVRDSWYVIQTALVTKGAKVVATQPTMFDLCGMSARRVEVARGMESGKGTVTHRLVAVAARDDTLVCVTFKASELEWPRYAKCFDSAMKSVEAYVGNDLQSPRLDNANTHQYGDVLLVGDRIEATLPDDWIPVLDPAPTACVGWQTPNDKRRLALTVFAGTDPAAHAAESLKSLPSQWKVLENTTKELAPGLFEFVSTIELPNGNTPHQVTRIRVMPHDRLMSLQATLDPDDEDGWTFVAPALKLMEEMAPQPAIAAANAATVALGAARVKFTAPKEWKETREKNRSIVGFAGDDGAVWLVVRRPDAERCYSWKSEAEQARMLSLASGTEQVLAEKKLSGGVGGQDVERTTLSTRRGEKPVWRKTRTLHRASCVATLTMELVLEKDAKPAAADKRAAPAFASFKIEGK